MPQSLHVRMFYRVMSKDRLGLIIALCSAASFGLYPSAAKLAYADGANQSFMIIVTTLVRAVTMILAAFVEGSSITDIYKGSGEAVWSGFLQAVSIIGVIGSLLYIPGPVMITIIFTHTILLLFFMAYKGEVLLTRLAVGSTLAALVGVSMVVNVYSNFGSLHKGGLLLAFMASVATMSRLYAFGNQMKTTPSSIVGARAFSYAAIFTVLLAFVQTPAAPLTSSGTFGVVLCCLSVSLGTVATFYALGLIGSFRLSFTLKLEPVFTSLYAIVIVHEILNPLQYVGIGLVVTSLVFFQYIDGKSRAVPS